MKEDTLINSYKQLDYILHIYNGWLWQDVLRFIGSGLILMLAWLNTFIENIVDKVITLNDFYSSGPVQNLMDTLRPAVWGLFLLALIILGIQVMLNKVEKRNELILNVILAVCMVVVIPDLMVNMGKITNAGVKAINDDSTTLSGEMIKSNVADLLYYAEKDFTFSQNKNGTVSSPPRPLNANDPTKGTSNFENANKIAVDAVPYINFAEKLDLQEDDGWIFTEDWVKKLSDNSKDVLKNKLVATGNGKEFVVRKLDENSIIGTNLGQESYYRYHVNWWTLIFSLLVTTFALTITIIRVGRATFDLAFHQIFGTFVAITDLTGGQRTKKIIVEIMSTFAVIFIMVLLLKLFIMYAMYVDGLKGSIGGVGVVLMLAAGAWALMDAPDIVQRMLGIDAGLRNGAQALMGGYAAAKTAGGVAGVAKKGIGATAKIAKNGAVAAMAGGSFARGAIEGMRGEKPNGAIGTQNLGADRTAVSPMPGSSPINDGSQQEQMNLSSTSNPIPSNNLDPGSNNSIDTGGISSSPNEAIPSSNVEQGMNNNIGATVNSGSPNEAIPSNNVEQGMNRNIGAAVNSSSPNEAIPSNNVEQGMNRNIGAAVNSGSPNEAIPSNNLEQGMNRNIGAEINSSSPNEAIPSSNLEQGSNNNIGAGINSSNSAGQNNSNTLLGGSRRVQQARGIISRSGNSGFNLGQNIRRVGTGATQSSSPGQVPTQSNTGVTSPSQGVTQSTSRATANRGITQSTSRSTTNQGVTQSRATTNQGVTQSTSRATANQGTTQSNTGVRQSNENVQQSRIESPSEISGNHTERIDN